MSTITETTVQVYQVFIKATPEQIWEAIIDPNFTTKYFHGSRITVTPEWRSSTSPDGADSWGDGPSSSGTRHGVSRMSGGRCTTRSLRRRSRAA